VNSFLNIAFVIPFNATAENLQQTIIYSDDFPRYDFEFPFAHIYYGFPEHQSDPSIGQSHILAGKRDGVTRELEKWSALIGSNTFCPIEGSD